MKVFAGILLAVLSVISSSRVTANVFASHIRVSNPDSSIFDGRFDDGTFARISFVLNDTASSVILKIIDASNNAEVATINAGAMGKGERSVTWDGTGTSPGKRYIIKVSAQQSSYSTTDYTIFTFVNTSALGQNIFTRGIDVIRNQALRNFGFLYAGNRPGGPLAQSILKYRADGFPAGDTPGDPVLNSTISDIWGTGQAPIYTTVAWDGRIYSSSFERGIIARVSSDSSQPKIIIRNLRGPLGIAAVGSGASFALYFADSSFVLRANLGLSDTLTTPLDTIARLDTQVRDLIIGDNGYLYVNLRSGTGIDGNVAGGLATERYDISGILPVSRASAMWSVSWTGRPIGLGHWSGPNISDDADDLIYVSIRSDGTSDTPGLWEISDVSSQFVAKRNIYKPDDAVPLGGAGGDVNRFADLTVDPAGNVVFFENGNEEIIMLAPPQLTATTTFTTTGADSILIQGPTTVEAITELPLRFVLSQNYPNPFNPSTEIRFSVNQPGHVSLNVTDMLGREVVVLVDEFKSAGAYRISFDAANLTAGTYFYTLRSGSLSKTRKMILLK
ncbi:MAG: T9SS type A sorting domain-containing protein [Ignavibacteriales bacterium]|nr:T9SS type A sorting domain-containing protein [Ignavibacteriales bacterium]